MTYKFEENEWLRFEHRGMTCIGRTVLDNGQKTVSLVASDGSAERIPFESIESPRRLVLPNGKKTEEGLPFIINYGTPGEA